MNERMQGGGGAGSDFGGVGGGGMSEIPDTWLNTNLKTVANLVTGNTPSTKSPEYYGGSVPFVKPGDLDSADPITVTEQQLTELGAQQSRLVRAGSTLVSCIGNLGKVGFAGVPLATNQQINSAEFHREIVDDRYGYYLCKTLKSWMERESSATTIAILNKGKFGEAPFPLAPLPEQKRIANKLDTVLTRVDAVNTRLARVAPLLKRFRQSVLAAATSGRLTEDWRFEQSGWREKDAWLSRPLGKIARFIDYRGKTPSKTTSGVALITAKNVRPGYLSAEPREFIAEEDYLGWMTRGFPKVGDVLITTEAPLGNVALISWNYKFALAQRLICLQFEEGVLGSFAAIALQAADFQKALMEQSSGSTVAGIKASRLKELPLSIPPIEEQTEIVRRVETLFAFADRLEARLAQAQTAATRLTPALLAKAFRGELVPQDPNDEPAAELLRRLAQAPAAASPRRGRKAAGAAV